MNLVLIETSGNQHFIFATNKLRENVGASELTYQIGTKAVLEAIGVTYTDAQSLQNFLLDETQNPPIEKQNGKGVEVIIATSGKALLLTKTPEKATEIVRTITRTALEKMPGLTVHGAIVSVDDLSDIHDAVKKVHHKLEDVRYKIPSNQQRFGRLPFVEPCGTSGLPATKIYRHESLSKTTEEPRPHSSLSIEKQKISNTGRKRLEKMIEIKDVRLPGNINDLEKKFEDTKWLSIIHADGNGLGEIFLNFDEHSEPSDGRDYIKKYRKFSVALDICTINAAKKALERFKKKYDEKNKDKLEDLVKKFKLKFSQSRQKKRDGKFQNARRLYRQSRDILRQASDLKKLPFIPLILGGDDLTVICDGEYAVKFTCDFLTEFENQTSRSDIQDGIIPTIANNAFGVKRLGICAGVAVIKPHYPFHQAYDLAENLIKSAKQVKTKIQHEHNGKKEVPIPASAMDFHVLYDSSGVELKQIREKLVVDEGKTFLYAKPYIVTKPTDLQKAKEKDWFEKRVWSELEKHVCAMLATEKDDEGKRKLPNSQLHHIRESLFRGKQETDSEVNLFRHRYKDKGFDALLCKKTLKKENEEEERKYSIFFDEKQKKDGNLVDGFTTHFLDALDVAELWKGFECPKNSENGGAKNEQ